MFTSILNILGKADRSVWVILSLSLGVTIVSTPLAIAYVASQSGELVFKKAGLEVELKGKEINKSVDDLVGRLADLEAANKQLITAAKTDKNLPQTIQKVENAIAESNEIAADLIVSQDELNELIEEPLAEEPSISGEPRRTVLEPFLK